MFGSPLGPLALGNLQVRGFLSRPTRPNNPQRDAAGPNNIGRLRFRFASGGDEAQPASAGRVGRIRQLVLAVEGHTDVLPGRVAQGIAVVFDIAGHCGVDRVVPAENGVLSGVPDGAALLVDDVARDNELIYVIRALDAVFCDLEI